MCHEATSVALAQAIGIGKGTTRMDDFAKSDAIFLFGQNPATNHPRMMDTLYKASRRGASIVSFNNLKERGLERFTNPQNKIEMITNGSTPISGHYFTPKLGGDMAAVRGMVKALYAFDKKERFLKVEILSLITLTSKNTPMVCKPIWIKLMPPVGLKSLNNQASLNNN